MSVEKQNHLGGNFCRMIYRDPSVDTRTQSFRRTDKDSTEKDIFFLKNGNEKQDFVQNWDGFTHPANLSTRLATQK